MGAEGKYDLKLANSDSLPELGSTTMLPTLTAGKNKEKGTSVLTSRKSSSTPSLPEATENQLNKSSVASTEQAASADNLSWKQAVEAIAENVLSSAKSDIVSTDNYRANQTEVSVVVHTLRDNYSDLSAINNSTQAINISSDLATIAENLMLNNNNNNNSSSTGMSAQGSSNLLRQQQSYPEESRLMETNNKMNVSNAANNKLLNNIRSQATSIDVIDKMRDGVDMFRNNANNILSSSEILQIPITTLSQNNNPKISLPSSAAGNKSSSEPIGNNNIIDKVVSHHPHVTNPVSVATSADDQTYKMRKLHRVEKLLQIQQDDICVASGQSGPPLPPSSHSSANHHHHHHHHLHNSNNSFTNTLFGEKEQKNPHQLLSVKHLSSSGSSSSAHHQPSSISSSSNSSCVAALQALTTIANINNNNNNQLNNVNNNNHNNNLVTTPLNMIQDEAAAAAVTSDSAAIAVSNQMSASVPNLTNSAESNLGGNRSNSDNQSGHLEAVTPPGLFETFAAMAKRRTSQGTNNNQLMIGGGGAGNNGGSNNNNNSATSGFFPRGGPNSMTSLVKLALSSNFHTGLLSTAQSFPSLTSSQANHTNNPGGNATAESGTWD